MLFLACYLGEEGSVSQTGVRALRIQFRVLLALRHRANSITYRMEAVSKWV